MTKTPMICLLAATAAVAGVNESLVGVWEAPATTLRIAADGRCSVNQELGRCQTVRGALFYQASGGAAKTYGWKVTGDELTLSESGANHVFRRVTEQAKGSPAPAPPAAAPPAGAPPVARNASDQRWSHPFWGVDLALPPGWKATEREGTVLLGSDTEPGLMVVRFLPTADRTVLVNGYNEGLREDNVVLKPSARVEDFAAGSNRGVAGELGGTAQNGSRLTARVIGILTPFGGAAIFLGVTTPENYPRLKPRVEALAAGASFTKPKLPPANVVVAGQYYYIFTSNSGSVYSREDSLSLCANGMFRRKGEMSGTGSQGSAATANAYAGSWSADGDGQTGAITLSFRNGSSERLRYQKTGLDIVLNGKKYGRFGDGSCAK